MKIQQLNIIVGISLLCGQCMASVTGFEKASAGAFSVLDTKVGQWTAAAGHAQINTKNADQGKRCLHLIGGQNHMVELQLAPTKDVSLSFKAERWTRRSPFTFRVAAHKGGVWTEIYNGDEQVKTGGFNTQVYEKIPDGTDKLRFSCSAPAGAGVLIDDVRVNEPKPTEAEAGEIQSFGGAPNEFPAGQEVIFYRGKYDVQMVGNKKKVTEHKDPWGVKRYRIPHITRTPDGKLIVAIVGRCSVGGDHGKSTTFFAVSNDSGKNWDYIRNSTDYEKLDQRPRTDFPMTERTQESQVVWYPKMKKYVAVYLTRNAAWFTTSKDLKIWSTPVKASFPGDESLQYWPSPTALQIDQDGSLLLAITGHETVNGTKQRFACLLWTADLKTFKTSSSMPCKGNETAVCPIGNGKYFVTTRISPQRLNMVYDRKNDTWSDPAPFPQPAHWRCEVDVINDDGTLYLTTPTKGRTRGILYKSKDLGASWEEMAVLTEGVFAYSSLVKIDRNTLGVVAEREDGDIVFQKVPMR